MVTGETEEAIPRDCVSDHAADRLPRKSTGGFVGPRGSKASVYPFGYEAFFRCNGAANDEGVGGSLLGKTLMWRQFVKFDEEIVHLWEHVGGDLRKSEF